MYTAVINEPRLEILEERLFVADEIFRELERTESFDCVVFSECYLDEMCFPKGDLKEVEVNEKICSHKINCSIIKKTISFFQRNGLISQVTWGSSRCAGIPVIVTEKFREYYEDLKKEVASKRKENGVGLMLYMSGGALLLQDGCEKATLVRYYKPNGKVFKQIVQLLDNPGKVFRFGKNPENIAPNLSTAMKKLCIDKWNLKKEIRSFFFKINSEGITFLGGKR